LVVLYGQFMMHGQRNIKLMRVFYAETGWKMPPKRRNVSTKPHGIASQHTVSQLTGARTLAVRT